MSGGRHKRVTWPWGVGLDKRQARRLRRKMQRPLPPQPAMDCVIGGCRWGDVRGAFCDCYPKLTPAPPAGPTEGERP